MNSVTATLSVMRRPSLRQERAELAAHQVLDLAAGAHLDRERVAATEWLASIEYHAAIAWIVRAIGHRVERRRPAATQDLHALARIAARAHRPDHLVHIGGIDVVVHHHDEAIDIGAGVALRGDEAGLPGVAGILLLDRDGKPEPAASGGMRPHALDLGDARRFEL